MTGVLIKRRNLDTGSESTEEGLCERQGENCHVRIGFRLSPARKVQEGTRSLLLLRFPRTVREWIPLF
jgi:hypothetical protein